MYLDRCHLTTSRREVELKSEEKRALVILGITAIFASIFGVVLEEIWSGRKKIDDFYFNVPGDSPLPHATYNWYYILEFVILFWVGYAFFVFWYFSADWLSWEVRDKFHFAATMFMGFYILYISAFVPLTYVVVVLIPPNEQFFALALELLFITVLEVDFV
jgi:hypothetical protein